MLSTKTYTALAAFALTTVGAYAGPTMLIQIPIADVLGHREFSLYTTAMGTEHKVTKQYLWTNGWTLGVGGEMEIGFDNDFNGNNYWSGKVQLFKNKAGSQALSAGIMNVSEKGFGPTTKFVMGRQDFKSFRLHAGWTYNDSSHFACGVDGAMPKGMSYMVDYISGRNSYVWLGVNIPTPIKGLILTPQYGHPVDRNDQAYHAVCLTYGMKF